MLHPEEITLQQVFQARRRISPYIVNTPLVHSPRLSELAGANVYMKLETEQNTRAFKVRGAANRLLQLTDDERRQGVVTVSTGNHGKAVATISAHLGVAAVVCVPNTVLPHKKAAIQALGAQIAMAGEDQDEAELFALELANSRGMTLISPFDDPDIIAGQGTIALEILEEMPQMDTVVVPLSGGGLLSGIALAVKQVNPAIRTIGVSMDRGPVMYWSLRSGHPVQLPELPTLADSLVGGIGMKNRYTFDLMRRYVDETTLVTEEEIAAAMVSSLLEDRLVVEGGGAVGLAALRFGKLESLGENVAVVVSGGNADMQTLLALVADAS